MNNKTRNWKVALCSSGLFIFDLAYKMLDISIFKSSKKQSSLAINEVLFYGAEDEVSMKRIGLDNLLCIYYIILHASRSIDVCVPSLGSDTTAKCFIKAQLHKKVKIRITIHSSEDFHNLQLLAQNGIEVKIINPTVKLEHEFILIDASEGFDDAVAVMGSLDYDTSRVNCNRDATLLTSETTVLTSLKKEFERVWNTFTDVTRDYKFSTIKIKH